MSENRPAYCENLQIDKYGIPRCGYLPDNEDAIQIPSGALKEGYWLDICRPAKRVVSPLMIDLILGREVPLEQQPQAIAEAQARECDCYAPQSPHAEIDLTEETVGIEQSFSPFLETVDLVTTLPGTILESFEDVSSVDTFTAFVANTAKEQTGLEKIRKYNSPSERIIADVQKRGFNGSLRNIRATVVTNAFAPKPEEESIISERELFRYLLELDMHSSGRGIIGTYVADIRVVSRGEADSKPLLGVTFRNLTGRKGIEFIDALLANSKGIWEETQRSALRNVVSAGLPSLGKRR